MRTEAEAVLDALAKRYGLDSSRINRVDLFEAAIDQALGLLSMTDVLDEVAQMGETLAGARQPWGVVLARLRRIPEQLGQRAEFAAEQAEAARWRQMERAAKRGETLRALVARGDLTQAEAVEQATADFTDDLRALALVAVNRGRG